MKKNASASPGWLGLTVGALGVVYGDIGTSPLYALRECFYGTHAMPPSRDNVFGVLSLIFWALTAIVSVKYLSFVLRAENKGEGGILSLLSLAADDGRQKNRSPGWLLAFGVLGAALLYGEGMITPAISVLSAIEGLEVATSRLTPYIEFITITVLVAVFAIQRIGTGGMGRAFGPIMVVWFVTLAALGLRGIAMAPEVLLALSPHHAFRFLVSNGAPAFVVLGSVFLVVTGAEALYADLGHFGARPIRRTWFVVVFPALVLNYLGQGALLLTTTDPEATANPFYNLAPAWALYPLVALATMAAVIASQALISGAFSISMQAMQLGYLPRMEIRHTSAHARGQIYLPTINWLLMIACIGLVLGFHSSSRLAGAYGIAATSTMLITTVLFYHAARRLWKWPKAWTACLCAVFLVIELAFFAANSLKILHGGWFPLVAASLIFMVMTTWRTGRRQLGARLARASLPLEAFQEDVRQNPPQRVKGTAVFMSGNPNGTPLALLHNLKHNRVLHERTVLLTIVTSESAHVDSAQRVQVQDLGLGLYRVVASYGFMDEPAIADVLRACVAQDLPMKLHEATFFLSRETIIPSERSAMWRWRGWMFSVLARNAQPATAFFRLPANRVVELGMQVEL